MRYLKLIVSRKATYAASLLPLYVGRRLDNDALTRYLVDQFQRPPLVRIASLGAQLVRDDPSIREPFVDLLLTLDEFNGWLGSEGWRDEISTECLNPDPRTQPRFSQARAAGKAVERHLMRIFFSQDLRALSEKYLAF